MNEDKNFHPDSRQPARDFYQIDQTIKLAEFASTAIEDLQATLQSLTLFTQLLTTQYQSELEETTQEYLESLSKSGSKVQELIEDLSVYSLAAVGEQTWLTVDLNQIIEQVKLDLHSEIVESKAEIIVTNLPQLLANPMDIFQLWQNLIKNAIKYCGEKTPRIEVTVELQEREWLFAVADNGIGISSEFQSQIFDIFQRVHPFDVYSSGSLGLAICQKIIRRYGGNIWFESEFGEGSTFYFTLPIDICPQVPSASIK